jgi:hypothetical protein
VRFILVLLVFVLATTFAAEADDSYAASASSGVACSGDSQDPIANASTTTATQSTGNGIAVAIATGEAMATTSEITIKDYSQSVSLSML